MTCSYNPFSLKGKTVLVTGSSSGIGRATAIECSKAGASVIICGRNTERLNDTFSQLEGQGHSMLSGDVTDYEVVKNMVATIPHVDGVVLCAGKGKTLPVQFCDRNSLNDVFDVNFFATVEILRSLFKSKKINKGGSIVVIDSIGGVTRFYPGNAAYGSSKSALNSFAKFSAIEFAPRKIRVNCICPAMIDTPLIHHGTLTDEQLEADVSHYPLRRYGKAEEVAYGAVYLLSDATSWMTGTNLIIDGGVSLL